jgi:hypothetical protein
MGESRYEEDTHNNDFRGIADRDGRLPVPGLSLARRTDESDVPAGVRSVPQSVFELQSQRLRTKRSPGRHDDHPDDARAGVDLRSDQSLT